MRCSRLDLFQTGMTSAPCRDASRQARNWARACCAKRSPIPNEYLPSCSIVSGDLPTAAILFLKVLIRFRRVFRLHVGRVPMKLLAGAQSDIAEEHDFRELGAVF